MKLPKGRQGAAGDDEERKTRGERGRCRKGVNRALRSRETDQTQEDKMLEDDNGLRRYRAEEDRAMKIRCRREEGEERGGESLEIESKALAVNGHRRNTTRVRAE
eukprot:767317-Hanusia_phi.AAC.1